MNILMSANHYFLLLAELIAFVLILFGYPNKIKKLSINPKSAIASHRAKPRIAYVKSCFTCSGVREYAEISAANINPIPTPVPAIDIVARPAPISLAASIIIILMNVL